MKISKPHFMGIGLLAIGLMLSINAICQYQIKDKNLYFPPDKGDWEKISIAESGWNSDALIQAVSYAKQQNSSGLLILDNGRILVEEYWGANCNPVVEDVASIQKSVVSLLYGIAIKKGLVNIHKPVNLYLGEGWSKSIKDKEKKILVRHLISMTSGLDDDLNYVNPAGEKWKYNTGAYSKTVDILEKTTGSGIDELTKKWLTYPVVIQNSSWVTRPGFARNPRGFSTTNRDLGRLGILILNHGVWGDNDIIQNQAYLAEATKPSQEINSTYGYLFWLRDDRIMMSGAGNKFVVILPDRNFVIVRLGIKPEPGFNNKFWQLLGQAMPEK